MIPKNTAQSIPFYAFDPATGLAAEGLTGFTVSIQKDDTALASITRTVAEIGRGMYRLSLTSADTDAETLLLFLTHPAATIHPLIIVTDTPAPTVTAIQTGLAMTAQLAIAQDAIIAAGDARWKTATGAEFPTDYARVGSAMALTDDAVTKVQTGLAKPGNAMGLLSAAITSVREGLATTANVNAAQQTIITHGDESWTGGTGGGSGDSVFTVADKNKLINGMDAVIGKLPAGDAKIASVDDVQPNITVTPEITTQTVEVTQETVNVTTQEVKVTQEQVNVIQQTVGLTDDQMKAIAAAVLAAGISDTTPGARYSLDAMIRGAMLWAENGTGAMKTLKADGATAVQNYTVKRNDGEITGVS